MIRFAHGELVEGIAGVENGFIVVAVEGGAEPFKTLGGEDFLVVHGSHGEVSYSQTGVSVVDTGAADAFGGTWRN